MKSVLFSLSLALVTVGLVAMQAEAKARPQTATHSGTFVSALDGKMVMSGRGGKEHTHALAKNVTVSIDGKPAAVSGLKKGMHVSVTTDKSGTVTAIATTPASAKPAAAKPGATTAKPAAGTTTAKPATASK